MDTGRNGNEVGWVIQHNIGWAGQAVQVHLLVSWVHVGPSSRPAGARNAARRCSHRERPQDEVPTVEASLHGQGFVLCLQTRLSAQRAVRSGMMRA